MTIDPMTIEGVAGNASSGSFLVWPVTALWRLLTGLMALVGRVVILALGFVLVVAGALLTVTVVGAVIGVPLMLVGVLLMVRSIF